MRRWRTKRLLRTNGRSRRRLLAASALACLGVVLASGGVVEARAEPPSPATTGFSREGLARIGDYMRNEVATGKIPGAIVLIQQHGRPVYYEKFGVRDVETKQPLTDDTIFRLYSMSKPVTSVAAMMLVEEGKLA